MSYNDATRTLLRKPRCCSAGNMFVAARVSTLEAVLRNHMYQFICRINDSKNNYHGLVKQGLALYATNPSCGDTGIVVGH